jgi:putative endonuclease
MSNAWCAYVLRSRRNGRLYTGSTNDLQRRLQEHDRGKNVYARNAGPFDLVYSEECQSRLEARRRERYLKTGVGREFLKSRLKQEGN